MSFDLNFSERFLVLRLDLSTERVKTNFVGAGFDFVLYINKLPNEFFVCKLRFDYNSSCFAFRDDFVFQDKTNKMTREFIDIGILNIILFLKQGFRISLCENCLFTVKV